MIVIFIAVGFVIDEILFEIGVDDWAGIIVGVIGVGFIADFCYRFWEVDNKLMFFSGYATRFIFRNLHISCRHTICKRHKRLLITAPNLYL